VASTTTDVDIVRALRAAQAAGEDERLDDLLAAEPVHHAGVHVRHGRAAFHRLVAADRVLHPHGSRRLGERRLVADGGWVCTLLDREAITNAGAHHENLHATFHEVRDGVVHTQVDLLDFRIAAERCDLGALGPLGTDPAGEGTTVVPTARVVLPDPADGSDAAAAKRAAVRFLDAYLTFEPAAFTDLLIAQPVHRVGLVSRPGREGFRALAAAGKAFYPQGIAERTLHVLAADGPTVGALVSLRATSNRGLEYHNLYGMFCDLHDGLVTAMTEVLDNRVAARTFDYSALP
jgi:ketosteroid isomerase-like protein